MGFELMAFGLALDAQTTGYLTQAAGNQQQSWAMDRCSREAPGNCNGNVVGSDNKVECGALV